MANEELLQVLRQSLIEAEANNWKAVMVTAVDHKGDGRNLWWVANGSKLELIGAIDCAKDAIKALLQVIPNVVKATFGGSTTRDKN
jgi:hypothetical protein